MDAKIVNNPPKLSICIPTFNGGQRLPYLLKSILNSEPTINEKSIEVVVSDNCSTDNTKVIFDEFASRTKFQAIYYLQPENVEDKNFYSVLTAASGKYRKLVGDSYVFRPGALQYLLSLVCKFSDSKPNIFFTNEGISETESFKWCATLEGVFEQVSYNATWIGFFGLWHDDQAALAAMDRSSETKLSQTYAACDLSITKPTLICKELFLFPCPIKSRKSYNLAKFFGKNYDTLLNHYHTLGYLSEDSVRRERKKILHEVIFRYYYDPSHDFGSHDIFKELSNFWTDAELVRELNIFIRRNASSVSSLQDQISPPLKTDNPQPEKRSKQEEASSESNLERFKSFWRHRNPHNTTVPENLFDFTRVTVGRMSYGSLFVKTFLNPAEELRIGNYVSISEGVKFILGGEHRTDCYSTFPFKVLLRGERYEAESKGPIIVDDFVWIGTNALILSGVHLGIGSVIAAGSVVVKDVPPFAIVGENPARVIRFRFPESVISQLLQIDLSRIDPSVLLDHLDALYEPIQSEVNEKVKCLLAHFPRSSEE